MTSRRKTNRKEQDFDYIQKILIIGDSGVGKSNVLLRYSEGKFVDNYMMTIGINYVFKVAAVDGVKIKLQIWDTAGQQQYKTITQNYYRNSDGVMIVFGVDSRQSFSSVRNWIEDLSQTTSDLTQKILVGNKSDLVENREVTKDEAKELANSYGIPYIQCSAKSGDSVEQAFSLLARMIKQKIIDKKLNEEEEGDKTKLSLGTTGRAIQNKCCPV